MERYIGQQSQGQVLQINARRPQTARPGNSEMGDNNRDPGAILRAYALPPGTPKDRVEILRKAFMATMKDADFVTEMKKSNFAIDPLPGEQVEKIITGFFKLPPAQMARLKEVLGVQN